MDRSPPGVIRDLFADLPDAPWPPGTKLDLIEHAKAAYIIHGRVMAHDYPHLSPQVPWDDQDAAVREAWIEYVTPEDRRFP